MTVSPKNSGWIEVICGPMFSGKTEELISKGAIETIKDEQNRTFSSSYFKLITKLLPLLAKENKIPNLKKIPHIGESHCLSFANQLI